MILGRQLCTLRTQATQHSVEGSIEEPFFILVYWSIVLPLPPDGRCVSAPGPFPTSALSHTAGSTKYFGTAKARYDFCARDRSELSLKEGDIIKILNKKGQQGWWRGEIYGRVSWGGVWQPQGKGVG